MPAKTTRTRFAQMIGRSRIVAVHGKNPSRMRPTQQYRPQMGIVSSANDQKARRNSQGNREIGVDFQPYSHRDVKTVNGDVDAREQKRKRLFVWISVALFVLTLTQPAFFQERRDDTTVAAWLCLLLGGPGVLLGYIEWLANPILFYCWYATYRGRLFQAGLCALVATFFAATFLARSHMNWPLYERESSPKILSYGLGYWLWLLSALVMLAANGRPLLSGVKQRTAAKPRQ